MNLANSSPCSSSVRSQKRLKRWLHCALPWRTFAQWPRIQRRTGRRGQGLNCLTWSNHRQPSVQLNTRCSYRFMPSVTLVLARIWQMIRAWLGGPHIRSLVSQTSWYNLIQFDTIWYKLHAFSYSNMCLTSSSISLQQVKLLTAPGCESPGSRPGGSKTYLRHLIQRYPKIQGLIMTYIYIHK